MASVIGIDISCYEQGGDLLGVYERIHDGSAVVFDKGLGAYFFGRYEEVKRILSSDQFSTEPLSTRAEPVMGGGVFLLRWAAWSINRSAYPSFRVWAQRNSDRPTVRQCEE